ncbi:MAG: PDZ domain-containing protein [Bryobacteraceae bacterium]|nr:PDZ domain-containing protein [Bryobacteraceae bacterium]
MFRLFLLTLCASSLPAASLLLTQPSLSKTHLVFRHAGDLWTVPREGGEAKRLTNAPGTEGEPYFSPDGQTIAFSGQYDGNVDAFTVPAAGGVPKRLTYHPDADLVSGWSPDGQRVLVASGRQAFTRVRQLFTVGLNGGLPKALPFPQAAHGAFSPDGAQIAYTPNEPAWGTWKRYRGGRTSPIWIANLADSAVKAIPRQNSNDWMPMWVAGKLYFLSDRDGSFTLYAYDLKSNQVTRAIPNETMDIKWASACDTTIAYERFGSLFLFDTKTGKSKPVPVTVNADLGEVRPRLEKVGQRLSNVSLSPTGVRAVVEARGEIFTIPLEKGDVRNLTNSPGAAERDPAWSPDGKWIAYFSDVTGEYELHLRDQSGQGEPKAFKLTSPQTFYYDLKWSPDSKKIAFRDKSLSIYYLDIATNKVTKIDTDRYAGGNLTQLAWSPDSKWVTYTKQLRSLLRAVYVYSLETSKAVQVTDGMSDTASPVFDADGKHLYFLASTDAALSLGFRDMSAYFRPVTYSAYVVVLRKDLPSPLAPESDDEKPVDEAAPKTPPAKPAPVEVKFDEGNIEQRILALPIPPRNYRGLLAGKTGVLFLVEAPSTGFGPSTVHKFELKTRKTDKVVEGVQAFELSSNREKMLFSQIGNRWAITSASAPVKPGDGLLKLDALETFVDPRLEWRQMYNEAWRIQRDFFYDPKLHGVDIAAMKARYAPYLESIGSRTDLNYLFADMMGEFTASHLYVTGGQLPEVKRVRGGLLGCDYSLENGRYRFQKIFNGESWNPQLRAPLTQPGVNVAAGEYLLAVNGRNLTDRDDVDQALEATAGKQVVLKVGPNADGAGSREVTVIPIDSEAALRNLAWVEGNRRRVDQLSGGRLAYVYLPDTALGGYTSFNRYFFAQTGKEGVVVDERFNGGGAQPDYILDLLRRPLLHYRNTREGEDFTGPMTGIFGPKAMLINEYAGSGGDTMPWYFRKAKLGPLVGKRTWGGLVGGLGGYPPLMDGGMVTVPSVGFWDAETGEWVAENVGIAPDFDVEQDPKAVREGRDPQLEKAVELLMVELKKAPKVTRPRPAFPNYQPTAR